MAVELATAYVSIVPSTKGIAGQLRRDLTAPIASAGTAAGAGFAARMAGSAVGGLDRVGGRIVGALGKGVKIGALAIGAGIATAIGLGLKRLVGIEEARAKLTALGHDGETVDLVMANALASVKGTSFGLADAATIAAGAVAAGVKPGADLERTLKLTADAAYIAGTDIGEMGDIFGKVAAKNKMMTRELNQLTQRGVPMLQWLADHFGVTAEAVSEMVSNGEVDFATFQQVMEDNLAGAAMESGNTTMGAFRNMGAAAGRFGAQLIGPVFGDAQGFFNAVSGWLDGLAPKIEPITSAIGTGIGAAFETASGIVGGILEGWRLGFDDIGQNVAAMEGGAVNLGANLRAAFDTVTDALKSAREWYDNNREAIDKVVAAIGPAVGIVAGLAVTVNLLKRAWLLLRAVTPIGVVLLLTTGLVYLWQNSETFRNIIAGVPGVLRRVGDAFKAVGEWVGDNTGLLKTLASVVTVVMLPAFLRMIAGWVSSAASAVAGAASHVAAWVSLRVEAVRNAAVSVVQSYRAAGAWLASLPSVMAGLAGHIGAWVSLRVEAIRNAVMTRGRAFASLVAGWATSALRAVASAAVHVGAWVMMGAQSLLAAAKVALAWIIAMGPIALVIAAVVGVVALVVANWETVKRWTADAWAAVVAAVVGAWEWIKGAVKGAIDFVVNLFLNFTGPGLIIKHWDKIKAVTLALFTWLPKTVSKGFAAVVSFFKGLPGRVIGAVAKLVAQVRTWATNVMTSIRSAFTSRLSNLISFWRELPAKVIAAVVGLLARAQSWARDVIAKMRAAFVDRFNAVLDWFRGIKDRVVSALPNPLNWLKDVGRKIIEGLINGVKAMAGKVKEAVSGVLKKARDLLPFSPAKEGPFSGKGWTLYAGRSIGEALAQGMTDRAKLVRASAADLAAAAHAEVEPLLAGAVPRGSLAVRATGFDAPVATGAGARGGGDTIHLQAFDMREAVALLERRERLRQAGRR